MTFDPEYQYDWGLEPIAPPQANVTPSGTDLESPDLLSPTDPNYTAFQRLSPNWFLSAIGNTIKQYCNWHIYPIKSEQNLTCRVGPNGVILLPTLNVVSVEQVSWCGNVLTASDFTVHQSGWIQWHPVYVIDAASIGVQYAWPRRLKYLQVSFTHGYDQIPPAVAEVGYEMAMRTMEKPAGIAKGFGAGPYNFNFNEFGAYLTEDQRMRLTPYALQGVA